MERIIHFTVMQDAAGSDLVAVERARSLNPDWEITVWKDPFDVNEGLLGHYYNRPLDGEGRANLVRLDALHRFGGVFLDHEMALERSLDSLANLDNFFCTEDGTSVSSSVFGVSSGHAISESLIEALLRFEPDWSLPSSITTGTQFLTDQLRWRSDTHLLPRTAFYSLPSALTAHSARPGVFGALAQVESPIHPSKPTAAVFNAMVSPATIGRTSRKGIEKRLRLRKVARRLVERAIDLVRNLAANAAPPSASDVYPASGTLIARTNRGLLLALPAEDLSITPQIVFRGAYEPTELDFIEATLLGGDLMVDVGCNVGMHSLVAAKTVGAFGRVVAFDPNSRAISHFAKSLRLNWLHDRVRVEQCAVGEAAGEMAFFHPVDSLAEGSLALELNSSHAKLHETLGSINRVSVSVVALDEYFTSDVEISVLKVDVEGFDHAVIRGARGLFRKTLIKNLLIEVMRDHAPSSYEDLMTELAWVESCGYEAHFLRPGGVLSSAFAVAALRQQSDFGRNVVLRRAVDIE